MNDDQQITLIAALDRNYAIGRAGAMPWHLPDDLKRFKQLTLGKPVLMGRKTALAIGRTLPGRHNLVLTRGGAAPFAGQDAVATIDAAILQAAGEELAVIGGGEVYALALPRATRMHLTLIDTAAEHADAYFPRFDSSAWRETAREHHLVDARHEYTFDFVDYVRAGLRHEG
jgi:dihydrofolate reductase